jgi:hypothetical protein
MIYISPDFGRNGRILGEVRVSRDLLPDNVWSYRTMSDLTQTMFDLQFEFSETSNQIMYGLTRQYMVLSDNVCPYQTMSD